MKIDTMRNVDYYLGIIICFFLTIICKTSRLFSPRREREVKNILFIQLAEMGSMVLSYSSIKKVKDIYPNANTFFLTFKKNRYCIKALNIIIEKERILTIRDDSFLNLVSDTLMVLTKLRRLDIDVSFDLELFSRFSAIISYLIGASKRVGFHNYYTEGLYRGDLLTHKVHYNTHQHMAFNFLALVHSIKYPQGEDYLLKEKISESEIVLPKIEISGRAQKKIWYKLKEINAEIGLDKKLIVVNPYAGELLPIRSWPLSCYIELIEKLLQDKKVFIIITGGNDSKNWEDKIIKSVGDDRIIGLAGKTSFNDLIDIYHISDVLITNDSGPVHFGSLTPIKTFAFFGPGGLTYEPLNKNAKVYYANFSCSPCLTDKNHGQTTCKDNKCLKAITVKEVYRDVSEYLLKKK